MSQTESNQAPTGQISPELYGENYYAHDLGLPYERSDHWLGFFGKVADRICDDLRPVKTLDVGCAFGFLVEALRDRGVDAKGTDFSEYAISQVGGSAIGHCSVRSALEPIHDRFDLITCIEVIEHLPQGEDRLALANMAAATDRILLSSTPFDYAEPTHVNVQPPEYWAELMASLGFYRQLDYDASYLTSWAGLFVKGDLDVRNLVKEYERSEWQFRYENRTLRSELTKIHVMTSVSDGDDAPEPGELESTQAELAAAAARISALQTRLDESLERLAVAQDQVRVARDAAIGAEAECGRLRGELHEQAIAAQAAESHRHAAEGFIASKEDPVSLRNELDLAERELDAIKKSTTWKLGTGAMAPYRWLRR